MTTLTASLPAPRGESRPVLLTPPQAADYLQVSASTLANWRSDGRADTPPFVKIGALVRYPLNALLAFIDAHTVDGAA